MRMRFDSFWENLRLKYWLLPTLMAILSVLLAVVTIRLDRYFAGERALGLGWVYAGEANGALSLLSTVAGSMITVAGVTFSITIAALTMASSQFGPRLLNSFMRDRGNQVVLGTYIATFIYCLLVMRTISSSETHPFVPPLSITVGILLAIASLGVLIYFIHHISSSINIEYVIANIEEELSDAIDRLFPQKRTFYSYEHELRHDDDMPEDFSVTARRVTARKDGYVQAIDFDALLRLSQEHDLVIRVVQRRGNFVAEDHTLVLVRSGTGEKEEVEKAINGAFLVGQHRLQNQDVSYVISQLEEIAVRALSPGINDPFTAVTCLDRLGAALSDLAGRTIPSSYYYDDDGNLRVVGESVTFAELLDQSFDQIRQYGSSSVAVTIRLLETIAVIAAQVHTHEQRFALRRQADMIRRGANSAIPELLDLRQIDEHYRLAIKVLGRA
jgi:uncharacterized membrane protein